MGLAIQINGRFVVFGTPNYLKTQYGQGYTIELKQDKAKFDNAQTNVRRIVSQPLPSAELIHDSSADDVAAVDAPPAPAANNPIAVVSQQNMVDLRYRVDGINIEGSNVLLSDVFMKLANMLSEGTIKDFQLTRTNLEQVFINFAKFQIQAHSQGDAPPQPPNNN